MQFMGADRPDKARARARAGMQARMFVHLGFQRGSHSAHYVF